MTTSHPYVLTWHVGRSGLVPATGTVHDFVEATARESLATFLDQISGRLTAAGKPGDAPADWDVTATLTAHPEGALPRLVRRWDGALPDVREFAPVLPLWLAWCPCAHLPLQVVAPRTVS